MKNPYWLFNYFMLLSLCKLNLGDINLDLAAELRAL